LLEEDKAVLAQLLHMKNDKVALRTENARYKEVLTNVTCPTPAATAWRTCGSATRSTASPPSPPVRQQVRRQPARRLQRLLPITDMLTLHHSATAGIDKPLIELAVAAMEEMRTNRRPIFI
jgi:hypothetical protein